MTLVFLSKVTRLHKIDGLWFIEDFFNGDWHIYNVGFETLEEAKDNAK